MATQRQIEANRSNALKSTGPRTDEGKASSRRNALRHGLAGEGVVVAEATEARFEARRASWGAEYRPAGESAEWALDRAVAASFRIEECERAYDANLDEDSGRARLAWDLDRRAEAAGIASRLSKEPGLAVARLESSPYGCEQLLCQWDRLRAALEDNGEWTEAESSTAMDLLGVPADLRRGRTPIDPPAGGPSPLEFRRELVASEFDRLRGIAEDLLPLDALRRRQAEAGATSLFTKSAQLILRYERDAWRRYHQAIRELKAPRAAVEPESPVAPAPPPPPSRPAPTLVPVAPAVARPATARPAPLAGFLDDLPADSGFSTVNFAITPTPRR